MPMMYRVPREHYFRIHHIRPRFKNDVENVLVYVATQISRIPRNRTQRFKKSLNEAIRRYPGNARRTDKTINNWRTEISKLFGLLEYDSVLGECRPGAMTHRLATKQDLVEFFKYFLYYFQYPGGHLKPHEIVKYIKAGVNFKPVKCILRLLCCAGEKTGGRFGITKAEATHCVFNDLRFTRGERTVEEVVDLVLANRDRNLTYDWSGDVVRYAGDVLDYMVTADLLVAHGSKYYLNEAATETVRAFAESDVRFSGFDSLYRTANLTTEEVKPHLDEWFRFVNQRIEGDIFETDILTYLGIEESQYSELRKTTLEELGERVGDKTQEVSAKEIGDIGEYLVMGHECMRLKLQGRKDLVRLVTRIPNAMNVGYDILSVELDRTKRCVEVKTTVSNRRIDFNAFHMTTNEWTAAESFRKRYFVYRLMVSKNTNALLFIIRDPVGKYKEDLLQMVPRKGADIMFSDKSGQQEALLIWRS